MKEERRTLICSICHEPGADVCVKLTATPSGTATPVIAHEQCGRDRGLRPLGPASPPAATASPLRAEHFG